MFFRIVFREIHHRFLNFILGVFSVFIAVACLTGGMGLLKSFDLETEALIGEQEKKLQQRLDEFTDEVRKITKKMGFNLIILPARQDLTEMWAQDFSSATMPQEYARKLADSKVMTVRHLMPVLQKKIYWDTLKKEVILIGIQGEIPLMHRAARKPILRPIKPGTAVLGHLVATDLSLKKGDTVSLMGRGFTVGEVLSERGGKDDISIWVDLDTVQEMLELKGRINAIWALECHCAWADLPKVRKEVEKILPDTRVVEYKTMALARAEFRWQTKEHGEQEIETKKAERAELRAEREKLAAVLIPLIILGSGIWIAVLAFSNVKDRQSEIGVLRAIGVRSRTIMLVFLARAGLTGVTGAVTGYIAATAGLHLIKGETFWSFLSVVTMIGAAFFLSCAASWIPALIGANQDPADILREE